MKMVKAYFLSISYVYKFYYKKNVLTYFNCIVAFSQKQSCIVA